MTTNEHIYALTHWIDGKKKYFYVGRSARPDGVRYKEHQYASSWGHTSVYKYIRDHVLCGIFEEEILCRCDDDNPDDSEFYWVVKLIREGHNLQNEKNGDAKRIAAEECAATDYAINTVSDVRRYRQEVADRAAALKRKINGETISDRYDPSAEYIRTRAKMIEANRAEEKRKAEKKALAAARREEEHQKWLFEQRALFEANGNTINGEHV